MSKAKQLFDQAFRQPRDRRSPEYRAGVLAAVRFRLNESTHVICPHSLGTAQADAWFSGTDEGHALGRAYLESAAPASPSSPDAAVCPLALHGTEPTQRTHYDE